MPRRREKKSPHTPLISETKSQSPRQSAHTQPRQHNVISRLRDTAATRKSVIAVARGAGEKEEALGPPKKNGYNSRLHARSQREKAIYLYIEAAGGGPNNAQSQGEEGNETSRAVYSM